MSHKDLECMKFFDEHYTFEEGANVLVNSNCRILNPDRVRELYEIEGEAVTWGSMHYKYIMNEVIKNRELPLIAVFMIRSNGGCSWELQIRLVDKGSIGMSPLEWVRRAKTIRWIGEDFPIHYELMEGLEE